MNHRVLVAVFGHLQEGMTAELLAYETRVPTDLMTAIHKSEANSQRFDILVLDARRDESFEAARYAKELGWQAAVIFVSESDDLAKRVKAAEIGCDAFLIIPDELQQLEPLIASLLEQ